MINTIPRIRWLKGLAQYCLLFTHFQAGEFVYN